jgi:DNA-binding Lrp family transcriptional regulator
MPELFRHWADGRRSYAEVGAEVGLSTAAVHERVKKMLDKGVIRRFSISVDPERGPELHRLRGHPQ